ncbi:921c6080-c00f-429a-9287-f8b20d8a48b4 [Thermothielavioides terrestris]|uniref:921c6080-c00f-429a-9287-f8b20d8a48b4 n=1 Tax=Thermothielavioides terrestris TaxID=2587410 RepID=A0A3S4B5D5_9PEZI|nr:921c6080-c00f-429a-9287-f8b20d8a48b4 [Thermothielavioides terrestris]
MAIWFSLLTVGFAAGISDIFPSLVDVLLFVFFSAVRRQQALKAILALLRRLVETTVIMGTTALLVFLPSRLSSLLNARPQVGTEQPQWNGPGKVLLLPCRTSHSRLFPQKHSFSYWCLTVGVPVGFEGNAGGMVSVGRRSRQSLFSWLSSEAWLTVDAGDYLERGKSELGLRGKLDEYLRTQGADPAAYPHAYLVTAARFLGYHFNPVSFWYLYDAEKRLAAMILEVNNTFDERRMYFLTLDNGDDSARKNGRPAEAPTNTEEQGKENTHPQHHLFFNRAWSKDFHVSPFNSRDGSYTLAARDPFRPYSLPNTTSSSTTSTPTATAATATRITISNTITLLSATTRRPILRATLTSHPSHPAVDPCALTAAQRLRFLAAWAWTGLLTYPRILLEAGVLWLWRGGLRVWTRPEPLRGTIGRRADGAESALEPVVGRFLRDWVERRVRAPVVVRYFAPGREGVVMRSWAAAARVSGEEGEGESGGMGEQGEDEDGFELRVLSPVFYKRLVYYVDPLEGLVAEAEEGGTIWVSRPDLLHRLVSESNNNINNEKTAPARESVGYWEHAQFRMIQYLRTRSMRVGRPLESSNNAKAPRQPRPEDLATKDCSMPSHSCMDAYVWSHESPQGRATYRRWVLKLLLADRIALGDLPLLELQLFVGRACLAWLLSSAVKGIGDP